MTLGPALLALALSPAPPDDAAASAGLLAPGAAVDKLWGEGEFTEGGALAEDGSLLFSDIGDRVMKFDPKARAVTVFRAPSGRANGLIFDPKGRLVAAEGAGKGGGRRVSVTGPDGKTLYVTAGKSLYRVVTTMTGVRPAASR